MIGGGLDLDLSGVTVRVADLPEHVVVKLREEWGAFVSPPCDDPFLDVSVSVGERVVPVSSFDPKSMRGKFTGGGRGPARFEMSDGQAEVTMDGRARFDLAREPENRLFYTFGNLLRACLAWSMPSRGGALVHAAGLVVDGRAFLLVGSSGAGKSTWSRFGEAGGGRVVSDDLVLVDGSAGVVEVLGSPFRSTHVAEYRPGRWPLAAILFPRRARSAAWVRSPRLLAQAKLAANLPFVSEALEGDDRIAALIETWTASVPCLELSFGLDSSFVDLLRTDPAESAG